MRPEREHIIVMDKDKFDAKKKRNTEKGDDSGDEADLRAKTVAESRVESFHLIMPAHLNPSGRLFGGTLMAWIDETAGMVGLRHAQMNVTTASVDNLKFLRGAYMGERLLICGKVTHVGNTSMEIKVDTFVESNDGGRELINQAYLTLVGLDENDKPHRLPRLIAETEEDKREWKRAERRRQIRKKEKAVGFHFYGDD